MSSIRRNVGAIIILLYISSIQFAIGQDVKKCVTQPNIMKKVDKSIKECSEQVQNNMIKEAFNVYRHHYSADDDTHHNTEEHHVHLYHPDESHHQHHHHHESSMPPPQPPQHTPHTSYIYQNHEKVPNHNDEVDATSDGGHQPHITYVPYFVDKHHHHHQDDDDDTHLVYPNQIQVEHNNSNKDSIDHREHHHYNPHSVEPHHHHHHHQSHEDQSNDDMTKYYRYETFDPTNKKRKRETDGYSHPTIISVRDRRIAGCLLHCIYSKNKAVDKLGWPTLDGLVAFYSEGNNEHGFFMATLRAVNACLKGSSAKYIVNRQKEPENGLSCDLSFDVFDCVSDKISEYCSGGDKH